MGRPRKVSRVLNSLDECQEAMRKYKITVLEREKLEAVRDEAKVSIDQKYGPQIHTCASSEADFKKQLEVYYLANRPDAGGEGPRHITLIHGTIGQRKSSPALRLLNKAWTWAKALIAAQEKYPSRFLKKVDPELDRQAVKSAGLSPEQLREIGLKTGQDDEFFIDLDRSTTGAI